MTRKLVFLVPAAVFAALVAAFAWQLRKPDPHILPSALIGRPAPDFALPGLLKPAQGLSRQDLLGRVTLVNFFASWCVPCREEHPILMALSRRPGIILDGIAYKDKPAAARRLLADFGDPYRRVAVDEKGATAINFGLYGVPETYVVDPTGHIRYRQVGPLTEAVVADKIMPLIRRYAPAAQLSGSRSSLETAARKPGRSTQP